MNSEKVSNFVALHAEMSACQRCPLHLTRRQVVPGEGPWDAEVMLVGEAPGATEDLIGRPFVGAAGKLLDRFLATAGLNRKRIYITNVVKCRPPRNRQPTFEEKARCFHFLLSQIDFIDPRLVILCGATALGMFWGNGKITKHHGMPFTNSKGRIFLPVFHTAAALRNRNLNSTIISDLRVATMLLENGAPSGIREVPDVIVALQDKLIGG